MHRGPVEDRAEEKLSALFQEETLATRKLGVQADFDISSRTGRQLQRSLLA